MNKTKWNSKIRQKFNLPKNSKIIFYRNPKEFSYIELERINPNHKMMMWGILRNKYRKDKPLSKIRLGKITVPYSIIAILGYYNNPQLALILSEVILSACLSYLILGISFKGVKKICKISTLYTMIVYLLRSLTFQYCYTEVH